MARTRKRALWIDREATYGTDASATGSAYLWVPATSVGDMKDEKVQLPTNYFTGRNFPTAPIMGKDGWSFDFEFPFIGMATAAGDGVAPPSDDWLDDILYNVHGVQTLLSGEGFAGASTTSSWILDTDAFNLQDILCAWETALPTSAAPRTQFGLITADAASGTYTVAPVCDTAPTTAAVAYGTKGYTFDSDGGPSLAFVYQDDDLYYLLLGGRITAFSMSFAAGEMIKCKATVSGDTKTLTDTSTKSALPAVGAAPAVAPCRGLISPVWFGGSKMVTKSVNIDWGLTTSEIESTQAVNGRADFQSVMMVPTMTVEPLLSDTYLNYKRNGTVGALMAQLGAGALSGGAINAGCASWAQAHAEEVSISDANGVERQSIKFSLSDPVVAGSAAARSFQLIRV